MWKILKAQIDYNKIVLAVSYLVFLPIYISFIVQGWQEIDSSFPALRAVLLAVTAILLLFNIIRLQREKRDRFHHILALSPWKLGISRELLIIIFWISVLFLVSFAFVLRPAIFDLKKLWDLLSLTGFVLIMNAAPFLYLDLNFCFQARSKKVALVIIATLMIIALYFLLMLFIISTGAFSISDSLLSIRNEFSNFIHSGMGALCFNLCAMLITGLSVLVFSKRRTFTE